MRYGCRLAAQKGVTDGASYRRATPDREPASRHLSFGCEILDGSVNNGWSPMPHSPLLILKF